MLWETKDNFWVLPGSQANPIFQFLHYYTLHIAFKITQIMNGHYWRDLFKIAKTVYRQCLTYQGNNPGKSIFVPKGFRPPISGPLLNTCSWNSFKVYIFWVINIFSLAYVYIFLLDRSLSLAHNGKETYETCFSLWVYLPQSPVIKAHTSLGKSYKP